MLDYVYLKHSLQKIKAKASILQEETRIIDTLLDNFSDINGSYKKGKLSELVYKRFRLESDIRICKAYDEELGSLLHSSDLKS